jgi:hypothetical protein
MTLFLKRYNSLERRLRSPCGQDVPGHVTEAEGTIRSTSMYSRPPSDVPIASFFSRESFLDRHIRRDRSGLQSIQAETSTNHQFSTHNYFYCFVSTAGQSRLLFSVLLLYPSTFFVAFSQPSFVPFPTSQP